TFVFGLIMILSVIVVLEFVIFCLTHKRHPKRERWHHAKAKRYWIVLCQQKQVLDDITLTLHQKEIVGLVAPNGTGKTTLLNVIMNNLKPDRGYVEVDGLRYESNQAIKAIHQKICAFPLESELFGELNGYEH
ncbi:ABC transporter ATP-binding protein, partial [Lacticaseibacillus rhamnosus MTCC 5462]